MGRFRSIRRRFGISAPRVAIQAHVPWYLRWMLVLGVLLLAAAFALVAYDLGRRYAGYDRTEAEDLRTRITDRNAKLESENLTLRKELAGVERQMQIEQSTHGNLSLQVRSLSEENALLKEDLAFFQTLMTSSGDPGGISINRFRVQRDAMPGEYRYRLLVVQSKQRVKEFVGHLQLVIDIEEGGKSSVLALPKEGDKDPAYNLNFKFYQRIDGVFTVSPDAVVKKVQVRILESGVPVPKSSQTAVVS
jgi:hypothetical protein